MPKFIIRWAAGSGEWAAIVEAADLSEAESMAQDALTKDIYSNYSSAAEPYSKVRADDLGLDDEETEHD